MRAGRGRFFIQKFRPRRDAEIKNLGQCRDARENIRKATERRETRSPRGVHNRAGSAVEREFVPAVRSTASYRMPRAG